MLVFALAIAVSTVGTAPSLVAADSCIGQLNFFTTAPTIGYSPTIAVTVPVSATCVFTGGPLYAQGTVYDQTQGVTVAYGRSILGSYGGNVFNGQLIFTVPNNPDVLQVSVSIYAPDQQTLLTSTGEVIQVVPGSAHYQSPTPQPYYRICGYNTYYYTYCGNAGYYNRDQNWNYVGGGYNGWHQGGNQPDGGYNGHHHN